MGPKNMFDSQGKGNNFKINLNFYPYNLKTQCFGLSSHNVLPPCLLG